MKFTVLISDGIDSPVAAHLMLKKKCRITAVHMDISTDKRAREKVKELLKTLEKRHRTKIKLYIIKQKPVLKEITEKCPKKLTCILCRRFMYRIAEKIAQKERAQGIVTGESLGQVASQTLDNIYAEDEAATIKILRPLIGLDKSEIIEIAKKIKTYDISILPATSCTFTPKSPQTHAKLKEIKEAEKNIDIDKIINTAIESATITTI